MFLYYALCVNVDLFLKASIKEVSLSPLSKAPDLPFLFLSDKLFISYLLNNEIIR
jgi:hypothetical protein